MQSVFTVGSTLAQGFVLLFGAFIMLSYFASVLQQAVQDWETLSGWKDLANWTTYLAINLGLVGLYGLFVYFVAAEEMSEGSIHTLAEMLGG